MLLLFLIAFTGLWVTHFNLLRLPYFWDEAGYFVPAAHDLFLRGDLIPVSVVSNAHPPLVAAYLAAWWKLAGFTPIVTRSAMLLFAAFALLGVYRLALPMAGERAALSAALCVAAYPVFFAQASLAQLDLAAAAFSIWGIAFWLERRPWACAFLFCLAVMAKETAVVTVLALLLVSLWDKRRLEVFLLLLPLATLAAWLAYHYARTGVIFGNAEFLRYNLGATVHTKRIAIALALRLWHSLAHLGLFALTLPAAAVVLRRRTTSPAISVSCPLSCW